MSKEEIKSNVSHLIVEKFNKDIEKHTEKVAVAFAEWMNEPVEKYSHGCLLRATPQKPDYKTYYLRIEGQSLNSNTVFYTLPDLYQHFINNVYNK